jgi:hypothetical protein
VELCAVVEMMFSLEHLLRIVGDARLGDRLESIAYNNLPATITADLRARQYDQQPNQVLCTIAHRDWTQNGDDSNTFGLEPNFGCCTANLHQGWPKLVASLWMGTPDGGLAALAYGPSIVRHNVAGVEVTIDEETDYPFGDTISFRIRPRQPVSFTLALRLPAWCVSPRLAINGEPADLWVEGGFVRARRTWRDGDVLTLDLPALLHADRRPSGGIAIARGPLVYALRVGEDWRRLPNRDDTTAPFYDWEVYPTTPWNYALAVDPDHSERALRLERGVIADQPFSGQSPPLSLRGRGRTVAKWGLADNSAGPLPESPVRTDAPEEEVALIPYGCARLRVTEMPYCSGGAS